MFKIIPILMGVVVSYVVAAVFKCNWPDKSGRKRYLDFSNIASASWVGLPPFQLCKFNLTAILVMAFRRACYHDGAHRRYVRDFRNSRRKLHR